MKLTPFQLAVLAVGGFASIIMLNVLTKYQSNEEFRESLKKISPADLLTFRKKVQDEEHMVPVAVTEITESWADAYGEGDNDGQPQEE